MAALPGTERILFFNPWETDCRRPYSSRRMIEAGRRGDYLADIEAIRYNADRRGAWHLQAP